METALFIAAIIAGVFCVCVFWWKYLHAYGTLEWTRFYRRVAPNMNGKSFKEVGGGMAWLTPYGTVFSHGAEFIITEYSIKKGKVFDDYKITAVRYKGTGDINDKANYDTLETGGVIMGLKTWL